MLHIKFLTAAEDYTAVSLNVTLFAEEVVKTVEVEIWQDTVYEREETFAAFLSPLPGTSNVEIGSAGVATVTILDDDSKYVHVLL